jgi:hypothetical protein
MKFFVGYHEPARVESVDRPVMVSIQRLRDRKSDFNVESWIMDSGAFSQVSGEAGFFESPAEYAIEVQRWSRCGTLEAAATQDYMCEPHILDRMRRTAKEQQERTVTRYEEIKSFLDRLRCDVHLMPVLQGWTPRHYKRHLKMYDLPDNCWVGVGSVCKRNGSPIEIENVLQAIKRERPDLRLHGFGLKKTALQRPTIRELLYSADSMAWSFHARKNNEDPNSPLAAREFYDDLSNQRATTPLFCQGANN